MCFAWGLVLLLLPLQQQMLILMLLKTLFRVRRWVAAGTSGLMCRDTSRNPCASRLTPAQPTAHFRVFPL